MDYSNRPLRPTDRAFSSTPRVETMGRGEPSQSIGLTNGTVYLTYAYPLVDVPVTKIEYLTRNAAAVGATLVRFGLYTVASDGALTLVARTANVSATALIASSTAYAVALDITDGYPASYTVVAGQRYAIGIIQVGATTAAQLYGSLMLGAVNFREPRVAAAVTGQTDLPASIAVASLGWTSAIFSAELAP